MYRFLLNLFTTYVVLFLAINISLLSSFVENDETQYLAIRHLLIFTAWWFTMRFLVNPERVPWIIILYSLCILVLLMAYSVINWVSYYFPNFVIDANMAIDTMMTDQQGFYLKWSLLWFDTMAFFLVVYFLENGRLAVAE